jgi:hypothetical protein
VQLQGLAGIPGKVGWAEEFERAGQRVELALAESDDDALAERKAPGRGDFVAEFGRRGGRGGERNVERQGYLMFGPGGAGAMNFSVREYSEKR